MVSHQIRPVNHCDVTIPLNCQPIKLRSRDPYSMMVRQEMSQVKPMWSFIVHSFFKGIFAKLLVSHYEINRINVLKCVFSQKSLAKNVY